MHTAVQSATCSKMQFGWFQTTGSMHLNTLIDYYCTQEGWLSPTERASVSAINLRHIIWLPHESHAGKSLPSPVLRGMRMHLATLRESKTHFGLPWVRPWDNRGKCYIYRQRIQCLSNASQHVPIYLQPFPSNLTRKFTSSPYSVGWSLELVYFIIHDYMTVSPHLFPSHHPWRIHSVFVKFVLLHCFAIL